MKDHSGETTYAGEAPEWALEFIEEVRVYEDVHSSVGNTPVGERSQKFLNQTKDCLAPALKKLPQGVLEQARRRAMEEAHEAEIAEKDAEIERLKAIVEAKNLDSLRAILTDAGPVTTPEQLEGLAAETARWASRQGMDPVDSDREQADEEAAEALECVNAQDL